MSNAPADPILVHLHGVINHKFSRLQRVDQLRISAQPLHGIAHGGKIDNRRNSGEILQQHAARRESDLFLRLRILVPGRQRANLFLGTLRPSSVRNRFSNKIRKRNGRCCVEMPCLSRASMRYSSYSLLPTLKVRARAKTI